MNARTSSLLLASLLCTTPAFAAPARRAKSRTSTPAPAASSTPTTSSATATPPAAAPEPARAQAPTPSTAATSETHVASTASPSTGIDGTGRLYAGGYVGLLLGSSVAPNFGLQVAGPIRLQGLPPTLHLEWLGALDIAISSESQDLPFGGEVEASAVSVGLLPGARVVVPVLPQVLLHGDLSLGLAISHASVSSSIGGQAFSDDKTEAGIVFRLAAGALFPLSDRLRVSFTPLAMQTYSSGGTSFSIQAGLSYALD